MTEEIKPENNGAEQQSPQEPPTEAGAVVAGEQPSNPNFKWYIIHTYSGFERKVKESIESRVRAYPELEHKIGRVLIPDGVRHRSSGRQEVHQRAHVLSRLRAGGDGHGRQRLARGERNAAGDGICGHRPAAYAAVAGRSQPDRLSRRRQQGKAEAQGQIREERIRTNLAKVPSPALLASWTRSTKIARP